MKSHVPANPSNPTRRDTLDTLGRHFEPEVREAYTRFVATQQPADADTVVLAIVLDHLPNGRLRPTSPPSDALSLMADLGFDSVAITEMVFFLEDLFQLRISNDEILRVRTLGDLRAFVREKLTAQSSTNPSTCV